MFKIRRWIGTDAEMQQTCTIVQLLCMHRHTAHWQLRKQCGQKKRRKRTDEKVNFHFLSLPWFPLTITFLHFQSTEENRERETEKMNWIELNSFVARARLHVCSLHFWWRQVVRCFTSIHHRTVCIQRTHLTIVAFFFETGQRLTPTKTHTKPHHLHKQLN